MNNDYSPTENSLEKISVETLSHVERERSWQNIVTKHRETPVPSPYAWVVRVHTRAFVSVLAAVVILVAGGSTVAVADGAKPGDALYAVDRATENVQLVLASQDKKPELQLAFAEERLHELDQIFEDQTARQLALATDTSDALQAPAPMLAPVRALKKAQTAADQVSEHNETINAELAPESMAMMVSESAEPEERTSSQEEVTTSVGESDQSSQLSDDVIEQISENIDNAVTNLEGVAASLDEKENDQARDSVTLAADRLEEKLNALPFNRTEAFRTRLQKVREHGWKTETMESSPDEATGIDASSTPENDPELVPTVESESIDIPTDRSLNRPIQSE